MMDMKKKKEEKRKDAAALLYICILSYIHCLTTLMLFKSIINYMQMIMVAWCKCRWAKVSGSQCLSEVSLAVSGILSSKKQK